MNVQMLKPNNVARIAENLTTEEALEVLIPKGFDELVNLNVIDGNIVMTITTNTESGASDVITIPKSYFNPENILFPHFLFQISTMIKADYVKTHAEFVLNQNEFLHLLLQNRLVHFKQILSEARAKGHNGVLYVGLMRKDLKQFASYIQYVIPESYNAKLKFKHATVCFDVFEAGQKISANLMLKRDASGKEMPLGNVLQMQTFSNNFMEKVLRDVNLQASSIKMTADNNKLVINEDTSLFRASGYVMKRLEDGIAKIRSVFAGKQSLPARLQTFVLGEAFRVINPIKKAICQQDNVKLANGEIISKDQTALGGYIVFRNMDLGTGYLMFGEIEQTVSTAKELICKSDSIEGQYAEIFVEVGQEFESESVGKDPIAKTLDGEMIYFPKGCRRIKITDVSTNNLMMSAKISFDCEMEAGAARLTTHCGVKGFSKVKPYLGYFVLPDGKEINADLVLGMNSVKADQNTMVLAAAMLAMKEGLYKHSSNMINTLSEDQVNLAASKIGKCKFVDEFGKEEMCYVGYVEYQVTEIARMFSSDKTQAFSWEAGRFLANREDKALFNHIWSNYVNHEQKEIVIELQKILNDDVGHYAYYEGLPVWQPRDLKNVFNEQDLIMNTLSRWPSTSKLLNEEINKGWYLDLRGLGGVMLRMPCAETINYFSSQMHNGQYVYPALVVAVSHIINACIGGTTNGRPNFGYLVSRHKLRQDLSTRYIKAVHGMLYSNDAMNMSLSSVLLKPRIYGINAKQMSDIHLPPNVMVMLDDEKYWRFVEVANNIRDNEGKLIEGISSEEKAKTYCRGLLSTIVKDDSDVPYAIIARNPYLWQTGLQVVQVWDKDRFARHLMEYHNIELENYLSVHHNRNMILVSTFSTLVMHSDLDGDLMPAFVLNKEGQALLREFKHENVDIHEAAWTLDFYKGEFDANDKLSKEHVYKLFDTQVTYDSTNKKTYAEFLNNASIAKNNIGSATNDIWTLSAIMELYKAMLEDKDLYDTYLATYHSTIRTAPRSLSQGDMKKIGYLYTRLVEDKVINAIKHMEGGSSSFDMYFLSNMTKNDQNAEKVANSLIGAPFNMDAKLVGTLMDIVRWANTTGVLKAIKGFIGKYNKGAVKEPTMYDAIIQKHTYVGSLVEPMFKCVNEVKDVKDSGWSYHYTTYKPWESFAPVEFVNAEEDDAFAEFMARMKEA